MSDEGIPDELRRWQSEMLQRHLDAEQPPPNREICSACDGEGFFGDGHDLTLIEACPRCHGEGWAA
jgi:DnaJ-class molecular chaperone